MKESILQKISNGLEALQSAEKARQKSQSSVASDDSYVQRAIKLPRCTLSHMLSWLCQSLICFAVTAAMLRWEQVEKAREQSGV